ncbi:MAG: hypothetical protein SNJ56_00295, partial [Termitinemataceae bacterium]
VFYSMEYPTDTSYTNILQSINLPKSLKPKESGTYNEVLSIGGGTVTLKGDWSYFRSYPDSLSPNSTYQIQFSEKENQNGTIDNVTVPEAGSPKYTINGKYVFIYDVKRTVTITTDANADPVSAILSLSITLQAGAAMSVSSTTGAGAKFILSFPFEYSVSNIAVTSIETMPDDLFTKLENTKATLYVYDNSNTQKYSISCTLYELVGQQFMDE